MRATGHGAQRSIASAITHCAGFTTGDGSAAWRHRARSMPRNSRTYGTALKELVQEKLKGHTIIANETERPSGGNVVDLMEALKRSIEGTTPGKGKAKAARGGKKRA